MEERYLRKTRMLDYDAAPIRSLIAARRWQELPELDRIGAIYTYVRDEILFGYNASDDLPASRVLADGLGQCNTKATLMMAMLRACGVACRIHGFTIDKPLQYGAMTGLVYRRAPNNVFHTWVEVWFGGAWVPLEGVILDRMYLTALQKRYADKEGSFLGYGVATTDFRNPPIDWTGAPTYIQSEGINQDFGVWDDPDSLLEKHHQQLSPLKDFAYRHLGRHLMNRNVRRIRMTYRPDMIQA